MTTNYHSSSAPYPIEQTLTVTANMASRLAETVSRTVGFDPERIGLNSIIRAAQKNEALAQEQLFGIYAPKMMAVCRWYLTEKTLAEDALLQGFYKAFSRLEQLEDLEKFLPWLRRIMVNESLTLLRHQKAKRFVNIELVDFALETSETIDNHLSHLDLDQLVNQLPQSQRLVFRLFVVEGFSHKEIAQQLQISEGTSKSQLNAAKTKLKELVTTFYYQKAR